MACFFPLRLTRELLAEIRKAAESGSGIEVVVGHDLVNRPITVCLALTKEGGVEMLEFHLREV